jgi:transcriptional regulator GlxA family with amidase domain
MQTALMITTPAFQDYEPSAAPFSPPQFRETARSGDPNDVSRLTFIRQASERALTASNKIDASIAFMTQHLNRPLQVSTLAAMVSISPSHYFALFKRRTGRAPMDYFTRLRMEEARRLLDTTESSVKEVAAALGYDDPFYFSRVFKAVNHLAPSNYRVKVREESAAREYSPWET